MCNKRKITPKIANCSFNVAHGSTTNLCVGRFGLLYTAKFWATYVSVPVKFLAKAQRKKLKLVYLFFLPKYNSISALISHICFLCANFWRF